LRINAARALAVGHEHGGDTVWQRELEDSFPFVETPDQANAIIDVKNDMETTRPMDRLICGDVGYGKTEIALRAAFKSVNDGLQVAILVPTTVLAQQHYVTFSERLSPFPVRVEVLSRFRTPKEQKIVIEGLADGSVDIVIGTHRLLQKDVKFKDLGLAVVDEEQRFGVSHKERLKQLRQQVDVLTLSATPIPRTLNMALAGIRDLSTMDSPPEARLPVKTFVSEYSEDVIKEAILREMERGGQVFYLHNRVRTIHQAAAEIKKIVPHARVMVGHGQMAENELEDVMLKFGNGDADVLVCTTIIESGLDMPNVNTLILERADRFGLAQLYQLRGRVGRSEHRAYAYLLAPKGRRITEGAEHRLQAILEASELGAGFRIAMRDLEIRGAGNILGASQSGHIQEVGLDLYTQLLNEAVRELSDGTGDGEEDTAPDVEMPRIELPMNARIPEDYVGHLPTRLAVYQRLAKMDDAEYIPEIREELRDRFGPLPEEVENLLTLAALRALAADAGVESIVQGNDAIILALRTPVGGAKIPLQKALGPSVQVGNTQMQMPLRRLGDEWLSRLTRVLERFLAFQENLRQIAATASAD
jgi:transcription-repair coupling factor (superfamily II helicase)